MAEISIDNKVFFVPEKDSPCDLWKSYYDDLQKHVGKHHAKTIWLATWAKNGDATCNTKPGFQEWTKKHGIDVSTFPTQALAGLSQVGGNILGMGKNLSKLFAVGIPVVLGGMALLALYIVYHTTRKASISDIVAFTPMGRAAKVSSGLLKQVR